MKVYVVYKETVYAGDVTIAGVLTDPAKAEEKRATLEKADTCANPKHPSIYYSVKDIDLDDVSLIDMHLEALECLKQEAIARTLRKSKYAKKDSSQPDSTLSQPSSTDTNEEDPNVEQQQPE